MTEQLARAADRHKRCAQQLAENIEHAEACYLIGLAAECALKYHLISVGFPIRRRKQKRRADPPEPDILYLHFPDLITELLAQGQGIIAGKVLARVSPALLNGWTVRMRYRHQPSSPKIRGQFDRWKAQTEDIFVEVGL